VKRDVRTVTSSDVEEQLRGVHACHVETASGESVADPTMAARRVENRLAHCQPQEPDDVFGIAIVGLVGELAGVEVEVVVPEGFLEVETHHHSFRPGTQSRSSVIEHR
jgi:hypothetical protein